MKNLCDARITIGDKIYRCSQRDGHDNPLNEIGSLPVIRRHYFIGEQGDQTVEIYWAQTW